MKNVKLALAVFLVMLAADFCLYVTIRTGVRDGTLDAQKTLDAQDLMIIGPVTIETDT